MSIMADAIIRSPLRASIPEIDRIARLLEAPWEGNHVPAPHPAIGEVWANEAEGKAAVYEFDEHSAQAAFALMEQGRRRMWVLQNCRAPHSVMFLDFPNGRLGAARYAILVEGDRDEFVYTVFLVLAGSKSALPLVQAHGSFDGLGSLLLHQNYHRKCLYFRIGGRSTRELVDLETASFLERFIAAAWMFLGIEGATVSDRVVTRAGRLAARRSRKVSGLHSFNRVRLNCPGPELTRRSTHFSEGKRGVRYHDVRGHWREQEDAGRKVLRWIAAYWRGQKRLGVVMKSRRVVLKHDRPAPEMRP